MESLYFDNVAAFPKPDEAYVFKKKLYLNCGVNVGKGQHKLTSTASKFVEDWIYKLLIDIKKKCNVQREVYLMS